MAAFCNTSRTLRHSGLAANLFDSELRRDFASVPRLAQVDDKSAMRDTAMCGGRKGGYMTTVAVQAQSAVQELLERWPALKTYEQKATYARDIVELHLHEENPQRIDECIKLYAENAVWETPARNQFYTGRETIRAMYLRIFAGTADFSFELLDSYATPTRVFVDMWARFRMTGDAFDNCPFPVGTRVKMRLLHSFHILDGLIEREIGYEIWLRDT